MSESSCAPGTPRGQPPGLKKRRRVGGKPDPAEAATVDRQALPESTRKPSLRSIALLGRRIV
jgi:hypothetical protein